MSVADVLRSLPTAKERGRYCVARAEKLRDEYFDGQRMSIDYVLYSKSHQFDYLSPQARIIVGQRRWSESHRAKEILSDQRMFERWALMFNLSALSSVLS